MWECEIKIKCIHTCHLYMWHTDMYEYLVIKRFLASANYLDLADGLLSTLYLTNGTEMITPTKLSTSTRAEKMTKISESGRLVSVKQHSSSQFSTQLCVISGSIQSSQKLMKFTTHGMNRAMLDSKVMALDAMKTKARVLCTRAIPIMNTIRRALRSENTPRMKPRACGMGPLKSTESQAMTEERRTVEQMRKTTDITPAMVTTWIGTLAILAWGDEAASLQQ